MSKEDAALARRAIGLLDLTNLNDGCDAADIDRLCADAATAEGAVAAACLYPPFVRQAKARLAAGPVRVATVANFPDGADDPDGARRAVAAAFEDGADEVDVVAPWASLRERDPRPTEALLRGCVAERPKGAVLKVILETGALDEAAQRLGARAAIGVGVDFLKTSTGKRSVGATPEAAAALLDEIRASGAPVGFKASGGVRTLADARAYLDLAAAALGDDWAQPATFRFGASGLLTALRAAATAPDS